MLGLFRERTICAVLREKLVHTHTIYIYRPNLAIMKKLIKNEVVPLHHLPKAKLVLRWL